MARWLASLALLAATAATAQVDPALVERARKEGSLAVYTSMQVNDSRPLADAFEKKYGIKVSLWRASGRLARFRAGGRARDRAGQRCHAHVPRRGS